MQRYDGRGGSGMRWAWARRRAINYAAALDALCGSGTADMMKAAKLAGVPVWEPLKTEDATL